MQIRTTRFSTVEVQPEDLIRFQDGLLGLEDCRTWVLLADAQEAVRWAGCRARPGRKSHWPWQAHIQLPDYQLRVFRRELAAIEVEQPERAQVLVIVSKNERGITLNLKAPVVMNLERRWAGR